MVRPSDRGNQAMTATDQHIRAIAFLAAAIRPAGKPWDQAGIVAALEKCRDRDLANVAMAALRAAVDPNVRTPGVIPTPGPHWNERLTDTATQRNVGPWCTSCGQNRSAPVHTTDHPFTERTAPVDPDRKAQLIAETRARMADNPGPLPVERTVDDGPCSDTCGRGAGHTGPHEAPFKIADVALTEVPSESAA